ncbi:MAG: cache domain-containing protein [Campylobacterales bacterium]|nr:cache domain-containing protein [Campylobacterales bacterium]
MKTFIDKNLVRIIAFGPFIFIPFVVILISSLVVYQNQRQYKYSINDLESSYIKTQKSLTIARVDSAIKLVEYQHSITEKMLQAKVKSRVDSAYLIAKNIYEQNKNFHSPKEIQKMITDSLRPLIWNGGESFIFILDFNGVFYLAPSYLKYLEGESILNFQDATGRYVIREEIALAKRSGSGYLWDTFTRPKYNPKTQFKQLAYIKNFGAFNWYIGSAEYLDTTTKEIEKSTLEVMNNSTVSDSEYFFVLDQGGNFIASGKNPDLVGKNILTLKDIDSKKFIQEFLNSANSNHPYWITYKWKNPASQRIELKYTHVKRVPHSTWIIGSGFYMEACNKIIAVKKKELYQANQQQLRNIISLSAIILLISVIISSMISKMIQRRFAKYSKMIKGKNNELIALNLGLEDTIKERTTQLNEAYKKMEKIAVTDTLTNIYNRYYFNDALQNEIHRAARYNSFFSLLMFDIDHFKMVNDTYGHDVGDQVLVTVVTLAASCLRESDIFARVGGEEFMIILPQTSLNFAIEIGERIRRTIDDYTFNTIGHTTISLGLVVYEANETFERILKRVDMALYEAKNNGRNQLAIGMDMNHD